MPLFRYTVTDAAGDVRGGDTESANEAILRSLLQEQGFQVNDVIRLDQRKAVHRMSLSREERLRFWTLLSTMLDAETPLLQALRMAAEQAEDSDARKVLLAVHTDVGGGEVLSQVMERYPNAFDPFAVGMVRAGEVSGALKESVGRLVRHFETDLQYRRQKRLMLLQWFGGLLLVILLYILLRWSR